MSETIIQTHNLSYGYNKKKKVLKNLSINVPKGSIYGFLGPNGAGKSTTMQLLIGILNDPEGKIDIFEKPLQDQIPSIFSKIGSLVESPSLYLHLSGIDNLKCITTLNDISEDRIPEVLDLVGLSENGDQKVKSYSLGMKQRLAIAMTMLGEPELLLLDEPVNGLDPSGITYIRELLVKLNKEKGISIFISSHLLSEIEKMCTHVGIIHQGELKFEGTMDELETIAGNCKISVLSKNIERSAEIIRAAYPSYTAVDPDSFTLILNDRESIPEFSKFMIKNNIPLYELKVTDGLEEWFLSLTQ